VTGWRWPESRSHSFITISAQVYNERIARLSLEAKQARHRADAATRKLRELVDACKRLDVKEIGDLAVQIDTDPIAPPYSEIPLWEQQVSSMGEVVCCQTRSAAIMLNRQESQLDDCRVFLIVNYTLTSFFSSEETTKVLKTYRGVAVRNSPFSGLSSLLWLKCRHFLLWRICFTWSYHSRSTTGLYMAPTLCHRPSTQKSCSSTKRRVSSSNCPKIWVHYQATFSLCPNSVLNCWQLMALCRSTL